jgi:MFS transporter, ACS family, tartrate transporter
MVGTTVALMGMYAALVVVWTMPAAFLPGEERPVGIALVTCVGLIASFLAPTITGWLKAATGSYAGGLYLAAAGILLTALMARLAPSGATAASKEDAVVAKSA